MSARLLGLALLAGACGAPDEPAHAAVSLALSAEVAERISELQVTLVPSSATLDCQRPLRACLKDLPVTPQPLLGEPEGRLVLRAPFSGEGTQSLSLQVEPGAYLVHVEALDAEGGLVANGCRPSVELREGRATATDISLVEWTGEPCTAAR